MVEPKKKDMIDEVETKNSFYKKNGGSDILRCIQCGTCSASCPLTDRMDHAPRELFALIRDGEMEEALRSHTPWYCVSCYQCMVRCPQQIPVTDLMYALKEIAIKNDLAPPKHKQPDLYRAFVDIVDRYGKITEPLVMARYGVAHPMDMLDNFPTALKLLIRGRLDIFPQKVEKRKAVKRLLAGSGKEKR